MIWLFIAVFAGSLVLRALRVPGAITWTALALAMVVLLVASGPEYAAIVGVAGLLGLGSGVIVRSLGRSGDR